MVHLLRRVLVGICCVTGSAACAEDCPRDACEALDAQASASIKQGLAGVASYESDVINNGCQECEYAEGELALWGARGEGTAEAEIASVTKLYDPRLRISVVHRYEQPLEPGSYVVCDAEDTRSEACARVVIHAGQVTTVHLSKRDGPARLEVHEPAR